MPLRSYRCRAGHEFDLFQRIEEEAPTHCQKAVGEYDAVLYEGGPRARPVCGEPVERVLNRTQRPIVKGGTRLHHGTRGVDV